MGIECQLVRLAVLKLSGERETRMKNTNNNQNRKKKETIENINSNEKTKTKGISFSNESQLLLVSEASVVEVEKEMNFETDGTQQTQQIQKQFLSWRSFRPNLVISGGFSFQEEEWKTIKISGQKIDLVDRCNRCTMICVDQQTGKIGKEPLLTLSKMRRENGKIFFGMHCFFDSEHSQKPSVIRCGDLIEIEK